ncbi:MBL fold metallo-hydrolase [Xanthovirga aplysinae]|uniref:MBL fold metallo-hydrolase n=1 Tax=Xanthovirga aplysinae TaxID=2529853 RepID=UPI0012BD5634|nr:MBL fold metallo-hydrolase [Xanthovirga aplysinae]MTI32591.1 MBL fold metallo-hydrolase [Xanthovirga aplysinae]
MIEIKSFTFNPFMENTYLLFDETKECIVVDPGCYENHEKQELTEFISNKELKVVQLLNTHCHIDHVLGNQFIKDTYGVELAIHPSDTPTLKSVEVYAPQYGFPNYQTNVAESFLEEGNKIRFGNSELEILFVPGHAPGHVAFFNQKQQMLVSGDVLFQNSIGRTDLPGGDFDTLINSIQQKLFPLGDEITVYAGHGPTTTIGHEKHHNPFCAVK